MQNGVMEDWPINAAFVGGGIASVIGLGGYAEIRKNLVFSAFSGASLGALIATCLAAEKDPVEIFDFLKRGAKKFKFPILGKRYIAQEVNDFLNDIQFRDLPKECIVSIGTLGKKTPQDYSAG